MSFSRYNRNDYHPDHRPERHNMTATEMIPAVGQQIAVNFESCKVFCTVRDVKMSYGRPRLLISPVSGDGQQWVELSRISPITPTTTAKTSALTAPVWA